MKNATGLAVQILIPDVPFHPWVGNNYASSNERLLILGEAHYDSTGKHMVQAPQNYTIETWQEYLDTPSGRFWTNIVQVVAGKAIGECDIPVIVNTLAFYNYCNKMVATTARVAPSSMDWKDSLEDFYRVLDALQPTYILVLGQRLWSNLKEDKRGENVSLDNRSKPVCYFRAAGFLVPSLPINHPSSAFSWKKERFWVEKLLAQDFAPN